MEQYIKKSTLVAEIKRLLAFYLKEIEDNKENPWGMDIARRDTLQEILSFIDTLEVKGVDLEDDVDKILEANDWNFDKIDFYQFAKHFFELGLKAQKEEPVSEDLKEFALQYAGHHAPYDSCMQEVEDAVKAGAEWGKNQAMAEIQAQSMALAHGCPEENTSEDLKKAADNALESISDQYDIISVGSCIEMFRLGAEWKKQKTVDKACKWIEERAARYLVDRFVDSMRITGIDTSITEDFRKDMED